MSVFDLPRLHFGGVAVTKLPTGPKGGQADLATHTVLAADGSGPATGPVGERDGGDNYGGNGHFFIDARVISVETPEGPEDEPGSSGSADPVVGRAVDMWGHYNEYLGTTVNRARVFDVDPASEWTTTLMTGQFGFGRGDRSHETGYMATGDVSGFQPPRWHNFAHVLDGEEPGKRSAVHQFTVPEEGLLWLAEADGSPAVALLRAAVATEGVGGLVVQFALSNRATVTAPGAAQHWDLRGTIAPWRHGEPRTSPAGRLLTPRSVRGARSGGLHNMTVAVSGAGLTLNTITAVPVTHRAGTAGPGPTHRLGPGADFGPLEVRTGRTGRLVARLPVEAYGREAAARTAGIVSVPLAEPYDLIRAEVESEPLTVVAGVTGSGADGERVTLLAEEETVLHCDDACLFLDQPSGAADTGHDAEVRVDSYVRGVRAPAQVHVRQFFNPRALPRDKGAAASDARSGDIDIVLVRAEREAEFAASCVVATDERGRGRLTVRGARAGTTRVLLAAGPEDLPCDTSAPGSAATAYDHDDRLGYWSGVASLAVRVLPDDWHLDDIPEDRVTFDLLYAEVFAFYEQLYPFMKDEVFSLADRFKVETYAKLVWQMCDPRNKPRTYYMPPSRDLSEPKARLLLKYLRAQQAPGAVPVVRAVAAPPARRGISTRGALVRALRQATLLELAVMVQYLYAAYSVPQHGAGLELVRRGEWTPEQLALACGDGGETVGGAAIRDTLISVAREEMIHFLVVNNVLMALGEPFHIPRLDFGTLNQELPIPLDFCLEGLGIGSIQRFLLIEQPERHVGEVVLDDRPAGQLSVRPDPGDGHRDGHTYTSLSELYADIRQGLQRIPDLFMVDKGRGGGEHHLFLRRSVNERHPDYQLEVDDLASALFAIDVVTEQGEGGVLSGAPQAGTASGEREPGQGEAGQAAEESHFDAFTRVGEVLMSDAMRGPRGSTRGPWSPSYPVLRNPTLHPGNAAKSLVSAPEARAVMRLFNDSYFMMLQLMAQHFGERPDASLRRSDLMNGAIDVMTGMMRPLAELLVTMDSGQRGRTAGPSFELETVPAAVPRADTAARSFARRLDAIAAAARACPPVPSRVAEMSAFLAAHFRGTAR